MKYLPLVWAALLRRKARTAFTLLSVLAAFLLFGLLDSVRSAFDQAGDSVGGANRLITISRVTFTMELPKSLLPRIESVPGVADVAYANWFGGVYQDPKNFFPNEAVSDNFFSVYDDFELPPEQLQAFLATRTGAVVGQSLAERFGWEIGQRIPLEATIFPQRDGSNTWHFDIVGIYTVRNQAEKRNEGLMFMRWDYFDEARAFGNGNVGWYVVRVADREDADAVAAGVDALSANSAHETKTQSESAFAASLARQFGDIGLIVGAIMGAVFFALVLLTGNTMAQAVRERIPELAVLKTLGFRSRTVLALVLAESVLLVLLGGAAGLLLAGVAVSGLRAALGPMLPIAPLGSAVWLRGLALMVGIGVVVGLLPAVRGMRLRIVDALAGR